VRMLFKHLPLRCIRAGHVLKRQIVKAPRWIHRSATFGGCTWSVSHIACVHPVCTS
jgi:hypothetical protein